MVRSAKTAIQAAILATLASAGSALAQDWQALVVGAPGPGAQHAFATAFHADKALLDGGLAQVSMLRDTGAGEVEAAAIAGAPQVLIYLAGAFSPDGKMQMRNRRLDPAALLSKLAATGTKRVVLLVEDCADFTTQGEFAPPQAPEGLDLFVAASAGPSAQCPPPPDRLTAKLTAQGPRAGKLSDLLAGLWSMGQSDAPAALFAARVAAAPARPRPGARATPSEVVLITPVTASPVTLRQTLSPAVASPPDAADPVLIFAPASQSRLAALPPAAGLPKPSIIVGLPDPTAGGLRYDDLAARNTMRRDEPERFAQLVAQGAFDPPADVLALALQQELARMGCYTTGLDGVWGAGSRAAVQRYFGERAGVQPVTQAPAPELFRQIIVVDDVTCPAPRVAKRAAPARTKRSPARAASHARAAPAKKAAPAAPTHKIQLGTTLGVFR